MAKHKATIEATEAEEALRVYFSSDARVAGLKATALERGSAGGDLEADWRLIGKLSLRRQALAEHRKIRSVLIAIGNHHMSVLWRVYGAHASSSHCVELWQDAPSAKVSKKATREQREKARADRRQRRALGLEVKTETGWQQLKECPLHADTRDVVEAFGRLLGLALETDAFRRAQPALLAAWRDKERQRLDKAFAHPSAALAVRVWEELGAAAVLRARVRAGTFETAGAGAALPTVAADSATPEALLLRMVVEPRWAAELEEVRAEAEALREASLKAFAQVAGYPVRVHEPEDPPEPKRDKAPRAPRTRFPRTTPAFIAEFA